MTDISKPCRPVVGDDDLLLQQNCEADYASSSGNDSISVGSSGVSTPLRSDSPALSERSKSPSRHSSGDNNSDFLEVPRGAGRAATSRTPSPLGLIPIHKSFSKLIHKHEVPRKVLHVSIGGLAIYLYVSGWQPSGLTPWISCALVPIVSADILRLNYDAFNRFYIRVLGALMRESEVRGTNGVVWYLVGTLTVLCVFPKDVATLSVLLLSWCDTAASTIGRAYGKHTPKLRPGKSLAGSLASFAVGAAAAALWYGLIVPSTPVFHDDTPGSVMWNGSLRFGSAVAQGGWAIGIMSLVTGFIASASEVLDVFGLDDNVVIPVVSAFGVWGFLTAFG